MSCPICHKEHHGMCHKCPHADDVKAGKWLEVSFDKTPCFSCRIADDERIRHIRGKEVVSYEEVHDVIGDIQDIAGDLDLQEIEFNRFLSALQLVIQNLLGMHDGITREIVMRRMVNDSIKDVAEAVSVMFRTKLTTQAVNAREKRVMKHNNLIRVLLMAFRNKKGEQ